MFPIPNTICVSPRDLRDSPVPVVSGRPPRCQFVRQRIDGTVGPARVQAVGFLALCGMARTQAPCTGSPLLTPEPLLTQQPGRTAAPGTSLGLAGQWEAVPHQGPVQPILGHQAAAAPALLSLAPLGPAVLEPDLGVGRQERQGGQEGNGKAGEGDRRRSEHACPNWGLERTSLYQVARGDPEFAPQPQGLRCGGGDRPLLGPSKACLRAVSEFLTENIRPIGSAVDQCASVY